jgi:predicted HAD superfamily Cof-like phosphohydrolase
MNQKTTTEKVTEFHQLFEHPIGKLNEAEPLKIRQLRIKLLFEELQELAEAGDVMGTFVSLCNQTADLENLNKVDGDNVNKVEELDAITDIQYVLDGKKLTSGLHEVTDQAFDLVHSNNMQKAHTSDEHAEATINALNDGENYVVENRNGKVLLFNSSGKVIKPYNHKKVDLSTLLNK